MKNYLSLLLLLSIISCTPENHFKIYGTFIGSIEDQWIYLSKFLTNDLKPDSIFLQNGKFQFSGICGYPESYLIHNHNDSSLAWFHFYLEPGKINIEIDPKDWAYGSTVLGGKINEEFNTNSRAPIKDLIRFREESLEKIASADSSQKIEIEFALKTANEALKQMQTDYVRKNPDSPISPYLFGTNFFEFPIEEAEIILSSFSSENKQTSICISFQDKLAMLKKYGNSSEIVL